MIGRTYIAFQSSICTDLHCLPACLPASVETEVVTLPTEPLALQPFAIQTAADDVEENAA